MLDAASLKALGIVTSFIAEVVQGGELLLLRKDGSLHALELSPPTRKALAVLAGRKSYQATKKAKANKARQRLVGRIRLLTAGLTPHGKYSDSSLSKLVQELDADCYFIGPFEGNEHWSAAPVFGRGAVLKHQTERLAVDGKTR